MLCAVLVVPLVHIFSSKTVCYCLPSLLFFSYSLCCNLIVCTQCLVSACIAYITHIYYPVIKMRTHKHTHTQAEADSVRTGTCSARTYANLLLADDL